MPPPPRKQTGRREARPRRGLGVRGALSGKPGLPRLASALGVAIATSPPPRLAPAEGLAASPRTGAGSSGRCRKAQRILGEPGSRTWDCGVPRDRLCNRQGPQPGQGRRPCGTSASRALPAAQPGRSLVAGPCSTALLDDDATILGAGRLAGDPLPKLPAPAAEAQVLCERPSRPCVHAWTPVEGRGSAPFCDLAGQRSPEASQVLRRTAPPLACSSSAGG